MTDGILLKFFVNSIYGSFMVMVILLLRRLMSGKVPRRYICMLWLLVMLRLIVPVSITSGVGLLPDLSDIYTLFERPAGNSNAFTGSELYAWEDHLLFMYDEKIEVSDIPKESRETDTHDSAHESSFPYHSSRLSILSIIWLAGCGGMLLYMLFGMFVTGRKLRFAVPEIYRIFIKPTDTKRSDVKVYSDESIGVPFVYGVLHPRIYIPCGLSEEGAGHVIRHELAHIKGYDHILKPLFFFVLAFYWYSPFVWIAYKLFGTDIELACDEAATKEYDGDLRNGYIRTLLSVAGRGQDIRPMMLTFGKTAVEERISGVLKSKKSSAANKVIAILIMIVLVPVFSFVHVNAGFDHVEITDYSLVIPMTDEESGKRFLLVPYDRDPNAYEILKLSESLEAEVKENSDEYWFERSLSDYTIRKNEANGLEYIVKNNRPLWEGNVLLRNERDCKKYDALAADYAVSYAEIMPEADLGYIYADYEVKGLGGRCDKGFWFLQTGTLMYINVKGQEQDGWRLSLTTDEYMRLEEWLSENDISYLDASDFDAWKAVLDELNIEYDFPLDPESKQYQGAVSWLEGIRGEFPVEGMSKEQAEEQIRYSIKRFDEDGDMVPFGTVPGMALYDVNADDRRTIIFISDEIRQMMFDLNKEEFMKWYGIGGDTERMSVYRTYQEQAPKEDRLKGTWTLEQYEQIYIRYFVEAVKEQDPNWQAGAAFDKDIIEGISREEVERYISSDGSELKLNRDE